MVIINLWPFCFVQVHRARIKGATNDVAVKVIPSSAVASCFLSHCQVSGCGLLVVSVWIKDCRVILQSSMYLGKVSLVSRGGFSLFALTM